MYVQSLVSFPKGHSNLKCRSSNINESTSDCSHPRSLELNEKGLCVSTCGPQSYIKPNFLSEIGRNPRYYSVAVMVSFVLVVTQAFLLSQPWWFTDEATCWVSGSGVNMPLMCQLWLDNSHYIATPWCCSVFTLYQSYKASCGRWDSHLLLQCQSHATL